MLGLKRLPVITIIIIHSPTRNKSSLSAYLIRPH